MKNKKITLIALTTTSITLMFFPGVAMTFSDGPNIRFTEYYSYFSGMPIGYGNWFPMIIAVLSIISLLLILKNKYNIIKVCLCIMIIFNIVSWLIFNSFTALSLFVSVFHLSIFLIIQFTKHNTR